MPRALRIVIENGLCHVTSRGWEQRIILYATTGTANDGSSCWITLRWG